MFFLFCVYCVRENSNGGLLVVDRPNEEEELLGRRGVIRCDFNLLSWQTVIHKLPRGYFPLVFDLGKATLIEKGPLVFSLVVSVFPVHASYAGPP